MTVITDMSGLQFGFLTVIGQNGYVKNGAKTTPAWLCKCKCGKLRTVAGVELRRGRITSCRKTHYRIKSPEYRSYHAMKARCLKKTDKHFSDYGGRGISICTRWMDGEACKTGFMCFLEDMGPKPSPQHSIDRIDNDGNYEPGNCRWATSQEQTLSKRNIRKISIDGKEVPLVEVARLYGKPYRVIYERIARYGFTPEEALSRPVRKLKKRQRDGTPVWANERNRT